MTAAALPSLPPLPSPLPRFAGASGLPTAHRPVDLFTPGVVRAACAAAALLVALPCAAQEAAPSAVTEPAAAPAAEAPRPPNRLSLTGRIELQGEREEKEGRAPEETTGLDSARLELEYERDRWLDAVLEVDLADGIELLDAFVRAGPKALRARVGQFKPPISGVELESGWTLPLVRRGIVHNVLEEDMRFVGRRPGVQLEASAGGALRPELRAAAFQGIQPGGELIREVGKLETGLAARASVRPGPVELGAFGAIVGTEPIAGFGIGRYWTVGADAALDLEAGGFGFRAWADALYGRSFYALGLIGLDGTFTAARGIVAIRRGGLSARRPYVEAFVLAETVRFDVDTPGSTLSGTAFGLNVGFWKRLRLGVQVEERRSGESSPPLTDGGNRLRDRRVYLVELGGSLGHGWRF